MITGTLIGRLGRDAHVINEGKENQVTFLNVASDTYMGPDKDPNTTWTSVKIFGDRINKRLDRLVKGVQVVITGKFYLEVDDKGDETYHNVVCVPFNGECIAIFDGGSGGSEKEDRGSRRESSSRRDRDDDSRSSRRDRDRDDDRGSRDGGRRRRYRDED